MVSISVYGNITDIHLVYFYVNPKNNENGSITYQIIGIIETKNILIINLNIITDIKAYKLNYYSIRLIIKYHKIFVNKKR